MKFRAAAMAPKMGLTHNAMPTYIATGNPLVDLFSAIGSSRGKDLREIFTQAYQYDRVKALKILVWARDARGGAGERQTVRTLLQHLESINPDDVEMLLPYLPFFGRWDDVLVFQTPRLRDAAFSLIATGLSDPSTSALVAKWCPRKGKIALELERFLKLTPTVPGFTEHQVYPGKAYRKLLSGLSRAVEQQMCAREWDQIIFDHVPSLAAARYQRAFNRRCTARYQEYKAGLVRGDRKVAASVVYPYDVIKSFNFGDAAVAKAQWEALPNYLGDEQVFAMVDVSGSMTDRVVGNNANLTFLDISTSLGLYIADKARGPFKDTFLTFSGSPKIEVLSGDIISKYVQMCRSHWTMNTNLHGAFMEILLLGRTHGVPDADMPRILLILSDMEFDYCVTDANETAFMMARRMYDEAGYTMPRLVFWNLKARAGNSPVTRENGTALVSGFSPSIMRSILAAKDFSPLGVMEETISDLRYDVIKSHPKVPEAYRSRYVAV